MRTVRQIATGGLAQARQVDDLLHEGNALLRVCLLAMLRFQMPVTGTRQVQSRETNPAERCELGMSTETLRADEEHASKYTECGIQASQRITQLAYRI